MKFEDYVSEGHTIKYEDRGTTTKNKGHKHDWSLNRMTGDGATSYDASHMHKIKAMVILPAKDFKNNHIHDLGQGK
jgi:hypothetical protein